MKAKKKHKTELQSAAEIESSSGKYLFLSFVCPFVILGTVFALHRVYPFGGMQIFFQDFLHQYYQFFSSFWHKLRDGTGLTWSWIAGGGHDYISLIAYYMASPLNLLVFIAPHAWLREMLMLVLVIKISCAGLFTAMFLRYTFKKNSPELIVFSSLYALCAFTLGYYTNIMWFDGFALLPLIMQGFLALMREGKRRLYIVSLAAAMFTNFYITIFICIFVAIAFLNMCIIQKLNFRAFLTKLGLTAAYSALSFGLAAVLLIPAWAALRHTFSDARAFPLKAFLFESPFAILGNFIAFTLPTFFSGLPNLYTGMISVLLAGVYIASPKIQLREKAVIGGTFFFLLISTDINVLNYILHGFRYPMGMQSRFSFLISFILVVMAYRAYLLTEDTAAGTYSEPRRGEASNTAAGKQVKTGRLLAAMGISAALFLLSAVFGPQEKSYIIGSTVLCAIYLIIFGVYAGTGSAKSRMIARAALFLVIITELSVTSWIAFKEKLNPRDLYLDEYEHVQTVLNSRQKVSDDFYRTELLPQYTLNDPYLYRYNGISLFSSMINDNVTMFMRGLGLPRTTVSNNSVYYRETTLLNNTFLNLRYLILDSAYPADGPQYWKIEKITEGSMLGSSVLAEYKYYLPLGFMVNEDIASYRRNINNPFLSQNDLFSRAAGLDGNLFDVTDLTGGVMPAVNSNNSASAWNYEMPSDSMLYAFFETDDRMDRSDDRINISVNGSFLRGIIVIRKTPCVVTVGRFFKGDIISFTPEKGSLMTAGCFNSELFDRGYALLADEPLRLTEFSEKKVGGTVTAIQDGILYTSIPGINWNVYVDGVKSELLLIDNAMAAVRLSKGIHSVEFRYVNKSLIAGIIISLFSLALFTALILRKPR